MSDRPATIPSMASKWVTVAAGVSALVRAPWLKLRRQEPDCWRRTLGLGLRSEGTRFGLSSFELRIPRGPVLEPADDSVSPPLATHLARQFALFLATEPDAHFALVHHPHHVERVPIPRVEVVQADYTSEGGLSALSACLDAREPETLDGPARREVEQAILLAHRATRHLAETSRPNELVRETLRRMTGGQGPRHRDRCHAYAQRLLAACVVSCEPMPAESHARLLPPDFRRRRGFGAACFDAVIRLPSAGASADLWLNIHHTAADGAAMQELLGRLERAWGTSEAARFPADDPGRPSFVQNCQTALQDRPIGLLVDFLDFTPLTECRATLNAQLAAKLGGPAPLTAVLLWGLAHQPEFANRRFATAVDVPPSSRWPRSVDLVAIRPADYFARPAGFAAFARDFQSLVKAGRARRSPTFAAMRALSFVPPRLAAATLAANPERTRATFGTVGLSILKDAKVFFAPMADAGWDDGFLALGNLSLPASDGHWVGVLTVKGDTERIVAYPAAFRRALTGLRRLFADSA